jgi:signal transduction histidine kinase
MRRRSALATALFATAMLLTGIAVTMLLLSLGREANIFGFRGSIEMLTAAMATTGWMLASRRPDNPIGWILLVAGFVSSLQAIAQEFPVYASGEASEFAIAVALWIDTWTWVPVTGAVGIHVFLLFPTGHLPSPRWRWVLWAGTLGIVVFGAGLLFGYDVEELGVRNPFFDIPPAIVDSLINVGSNLYLAGVLGAAASLVVRFRRSRGDERQQIKWFAGAAAIWAVFIVVTFFGELIFTEPILIRIGGIGAVVGFMAIPVAIGVAVLKYRLYELDVVVSRAVLYGALVAIITLVYVGIVVGIGTAIGSRGNVVLSILATAIIALLFQPLRERVRRVANRMVYGRRATPYEVLSQFSEGLETVYSAEDALPHMARLVGEGTGGETAIWVRVGEDLLLTASWPVEIGRARVPAGTNGELPQFSDWDRAFPVRHRGDVLGALSIRKPPQEPLTGAEERLVADVASQAGLVLGNVRLIEELRASRQRLVTAQDEERRKLERDIHDGAQQQLVAMSVKLRLARNLAAKDPAKAAEMLEQLQTENQETLETLRDLARGIYPPLLADQGLAPALEAQGRKAAIPVEVNSDGTGRYPQEVEAAAYFCCLEAMQNVAKYAEASRIRIRVWAESGVLAFSVEDDGRGFDRVTTSAGSGMRNMGDRIDALGGTLEIVSSPGAGTTVTGRIPAQAVAAPQASASLSGSNSDFGM